MVLIDELFFVFSMIQWIGLSHISVIEKNNIWEMLLFSTNITFLLHCYENFILFWKVKIFCTNAFELNSYLGQKMRARTSLALR